MFKIEQLFKVERRRQEEHIHGAQQKRARQEEAAGNRAEAAETVGRKVSLALFIILPP